ncbi:nucleoside phosphorylase [Aquimarina sp. D1M17]|uniref:nucleoside phosphorylase n=1 Tax=Aquimarina acroporae TaxID=2937283 RepID=UPI0020BEDE39|nr:nucleoside phosphorylase [Aquimarina acroporae]MCK8520598.1 nucleoside phosphorylase [Aquimarina acroporae]
MAIAESELILNEDGSIYHLNLKPEHLANTIITVGDPDRVEQVTQYFDRIEHKVRKREFHTQTGYYQGKRMTVISTGIGTDNIDIVFNELDALVNIDFENRDIKKEHTSLTIVRVGTSGAIQEDIPIDSFVISEIGIGFDSLLHFYKNEDIQLHDLSQALMQHLNWDRNKSNPYCIACDEDLASHLQSEITIKGNTITNVGFYGPQGRILRLPLQDNKMNKKLESFRYNNELKVTNLEMETAGIYAMAKLLGHRAISMNAILANRATGEFSKNPKQTVDKLIKHTLVKLVSFEG